MLPRVLQNRALTPPKAVNADARPWLPRRLRRVLKAITRPARILGAVAIVALGAVTHALSGGGWATAREAALAAVAVRGLALDQVSLEGHRFTTDQDIFAAVGTYRTLFDIDMAQAKDRIEALPWIETAILRRTFPGTLSITVTERKARAVWYKGDETLLIDDTGRQLARIPPDADTRRYGANLLRLSGFAAGPATPDALRLIAAFPGVAHRAHHFEHVAGRRWTIHLSDGPRLHLPADRPLDALRRALDLEREGRLRGITDVDVRTATRTVLVPEKTPPKLTAPASQPSPPKT
jgi:cell division protein FtsQ